MRSPADYLVDLPEAIPKATAERLLTQVLAEAAREKQTYAHLLLRAVRRDAKPTAATSHQPPAVL
ncbi:MAG: hypothetical protein ACRYFZ_09620 [Janthinobacterium lividum]